MEAKIRIEGLVKEYESFSLKQISLEIPKGSVTGLVGANGAGKTTLLKCIMGIVRKDQGEIFIDEEKVEEKNKDWKNQVGMVLAEANFHEYMNAEQIGKVMNEIYSRWEPEQYNNYLKTFGIEKKKRIKEYSRGMKMKLQIAVALSHHAELLIFDEATSGLDPLVRDDLLDMILEYMQNENHTVLLSSHIITDLEKVSDYIAFIQKGSLVFMKEKDELLYQYGVAKCTEEQLETLDKRMILRVRRSAMSCEILVKDREAFVRRYPDIVMDYTGIEEIMLLMENGEPV